MLNSKLLFILVINLGLLALNFMLSVDNISEFVLNAQAAEITPVSERPQQTTSTAPLSVEESTNSEEIAERPPEKQNNEQKLALLAAQLAALKEQNQKLAAQVKTLSGELATQNSNVRALQKENSELQLAQSKKPPALASDADLLKTKIQSQPDLLPGDTPESGVVKPAAQIEEDKQLLAVAEKEPLADFSGAFEFGFSYAQDNNVIRSLNGRLIFDYEKDDTYKLNSNFKFGFKEKNHEMDTERYRWQLQGDYYLDPDNFVFARSDMQRSQFASYEKEDIYTLGYGRIVFAEKNHKFDIEIGPGYRMAVPNDGQDAVSVDEFIARTRFNYQRIISDSLQVKMGSVVEIGNQNSIYGVNFTAQNKIYRELYLIYDSEYKYTKNVPVDTLNEEVFTGLNLMYAF